MIVFKHSSDRESVETLNDWEWPTDPDWGICWTISILTLPNLIQRWVAAKCLCNNHHVLCCSIRSLLRGVIRRKKWCLEKAGGERNRVGSETNCDHGHRFSPQVVFKSSSCCWSVTLMGSTIAPVFYLSLRRQSHQKKMEFWKESFICFAFLIT